MIGNSEFLSVSVWAESGSAAMLAIPVAVYTLCKSEFMLVDECVGIVSSAGMCLPAMPHAPPKNCICAQRNPMETRGALIGSPIYSISACHIPYCIVTFIVLAKVIWICSASILNKEAGHVAWYGASGVTRWNIPCGFSYCSLVLCHPVNASNECCTSSLIRIETLEFA